MTMPYAVELIEGILRIGSALPLTIAIVVIAVLLYADKLYHPYLWKYIGAILTGIAIWRWILVLIVYDEFWPDFVDALEPWVQPINQATFMLIGIIFIILPLAFKKDDEDA